jgi:hypothetical protein
MHKLLNYLIYLIRHFKMAICHLVFIFKEMSKKHERKPIELKKVQQGRVVQRVVTSLKTYAFTECLFRKYWKIERNFPRSISLREGAFLNI